MELRRSRTRAERRVAGTTSAVVVRLGRLISCRHSASRGKPRHVLIERAVRAVAVAVRARMVVTRSCVSVRPTAM